MRRLIVLMLACLLAACGVRESAAPSLPAPSPVLARASLANAVRDGIGAAVASPTAQPANPVAATLGAPFQLDAAHPTATLAAEGLTVHLDQVAEDSRCPVNARCIWAGRAAVRVSLRDAAASETLTLVLGGINQLDAPAPTFGGYSVSLTALEPYPQAGKSSTASTATLVVRRAP